MESMGPMSAILKADPRPTILIDLNDPVTKFVFKFSSCNGALLSRTAVRDELFHMNSASAQFLEWIHADASFDPDEAYAFAGLRWVKFTVEKIWRVVGVMSLFQRVDHVVDKAMEKVDARVVNHSLPLRVKTPEPVDISIILTQPDSSKSVPEAVDSLRPNILSQEAQSVGDKGQRLIEDPSGQFASGMSNFHQLLKVMMRNDRIAEMTTIGMFDFLPSGKLFQANDCWYQTSGHSRDPADATEFSFMSCVYEDDKELVMDKWNTLARGVPVTFEMRWKGKENQPTWVSAACVPFISDDGELISISGFTFDKSAKKEKEQHRIDRAAAIERAEISENRFASFAELAPAAIWVLDSDYQVTYGNDKYFEILGSPRVPYNELKWADFVVAEDLNAIVDGLNALVERKVRQNFEFRLKRPWIGGEDIEGESWVTASGYPDFHENGDIKEILGTMSEVSRYKWAESVQKRRVEEVLELKRQQENFIDMTSHEIRNPISAVIQSADLISTSLYEISAIIDSSTPDEQGTDNTKLLSIIESNFEAVQTIIACSIHQKLIVDDILTVSKLDSRLLLITPTKVQAVSIIKDTLKMSKAEAQVADVKISYQEHESLNSLNIDWVMMDSSRVLQVFVNLLTNAIKFTQTETKREINVSVRATKEKPEESEGYIAPKTISDDITNDPEWGHGEIIFLHFIISDTGRGLTAEHMAKLFFRFSQATPRTHIEYGGSGLGLFVSRELAELQGGQIRVVSEYRRGSTFSFYIKCRKASSPGDSRDNIVTRMSSVKYGMRSPPHEGTVFVLPTQEMPFSLKGYHVLLVEDNLVNQRVLRKQLEKIDAKVEVAGNGVEALARIDETVWRGGEKSLAVVLMDLEMPVMGGLECVRRIRDMEKRDEIKGHLPVIVVSANARSEQVEQATESGSDDFVRKPFRIGELVPKIVTFVKKTAMNETKKA